MVCDCKGVALIWLITLKLIFGKQRFMLIEQWSCWVVPTSPVEPCRKTLPSCSVEASPSKAMVIKACFCNAKAEEKAV